MGDIVQSERENTVRLQLKPNVSLVSRCCPADLGCDLVDISNSLLTLWLLLWCCVGHVVLVCNPRKETGQSTVYNGVGRELLESCIGEAEGGTPLQETVHSYRGESALFVLDHQR